MKTESILSQRVNEHQKQDSSACKQHITAINICFYFDGIKILDSAENNIQQQIKELLNRFEHKTILNKKFVSQSKFEENILIIRAFA